MTPRRSSDADADADPVDAAAPLPAGPRAGVRACQVVHAIADGRPGRRRTAASSRTSAPFVLRPTLTTRAVDRRDATIGSPPSHGDVHRVRADAARAAADATSASSCSLNELDPPAGQPRAPTRFAAPAGNGVADPDPDTATVDVPFARRRRAPTSCACRSTAPRARSLDAGAARFATPSGGRCHERARRLDARPTSGTSSRALDACAALLDAHDGAAGRRGGHARSRGDAAAATPRAAALDALRRSFGLSPFERDVLLLCAGVELDARVRAPLCAAAQGDPAAPYPDVRPGARRASRRALERARAGARRCARWRLIELAPAPAL